MNIDVSPIKRRLEQELKTADEMIDGGHPEIPYWRGITIGLKTALSIISEEEPEPSEISTFAKEFNL